VQVAGLTPGLAGVAVLPNDLLLRIDDEDAVVASVADQDVAAWQNLRQGRLVEFAGPLVTS